MNGGFKNFVNQNHESLMRSKRLTSRVPNYSIIKSNESKQISKVVTSISSSKDS